MKRVYNTSHSSPPQHKIATMYDKFKQMSLNQILMTVLCIMLLCTSITGIIYFAVIKNDKTMSNPAPEAHALSNTEIESTQTPIIVVKDEYSSVKQLDVTYNGPQLYENDILDINNLTSVLTYKDDTTVPLDINQLTFITDITAPLSLGDNAITVQYDSYEWTFNINTIAKNPVATATANYVDEINNATYTHITDNTFITITKYTDPDIYWLAHIIINDPSQIAVTTAYNKFGPRQTSLLNEQQFGWVFGINASHFENTDDILPGLYINKDNIYQTTTDNVTLGNEMCITDKGILFSAEPGTPLETLRNAGVLYTVISDNPTIIVDGNPLPINTNTRGPKTAIGQVSPNEFYMIVASDGDYDTLVSYKNIQDIMCEKNCTYARILDGSTNSSMMINYITVNSPACGPGRPLKDLLVIYD